MPAQPQLLQLRRRGGRPALIQPTKMGHVFILDRHTGVPLYPVEERPVPQDGVPGETLAPTQPFPTHPAPLHPTELTPENVFGFTPWDTAIVSREARGLRNDGLFTPPSLEGSISTRPRGRDELGRRLDRSRERRLIANQSHRGLCEARAARGVRRDAQGRRDLSRGGLPDGRHALRREPQPAPLALGAPCTPPPWGALSAVDLATGEVLWGVRLGTTRDQAPFPIWAIPDSGSRRAELRGGCSPRAASTSSAPRATSSSARSTPTRARRSGARGSPIPAMRRRCAIGCTPTRASSS